MENQTKDYSNIQHVAIIPDGNRRWAKEHNLPSLEGHRRGFESANACIKKARDLGIHTMTLWAFSTENWNRTKEEITYLMKLFESNIASNLKEAHKSEGKIIHLGRKDRIPESLRKMMEKAENETKDYNKHLLNIALDYGGHDEILRAIQQAITDVETGKITKEDLIKAPERYEGKYPYYLFKDYLDTKDQPHPFPDLLIRTSGEQRLSGFLSWQMAYSELYFAQVHMPDFGPEQLIEALNDFNNRERRFGGDAKK